MHSRIFHIELEEHRNRLKEEPLMECDFEYDMEHEWFVGSIADYVDECTDKENDIRWFINSMESYNEYFTINNEDTEIASITFFPGFKQAFFESRLVRLKEMVRDMTIDEFTDSMMSFRLRDIIHDKFGFYIYSYDNGLISIDEFVRNIPDIEITYYFGNTIDYHF